MVMVVRPPAGGLLRRSVFVLIWAEVVVVEVGVGLVELSFSLAAAAMALSSSVSTLHISQARTCCTSRPLSNRDSMTFTSSRRGKGSLPPEADMAGVVIVFCLRGLLLGRGCSSEKELRDVGAKKMLPLLSLSLFCLSRAVLLLQMLLQMLLLQMLLLQVVVVLRFPSSRKRVSFSCTAPPPEAKPHRRNVSIVSLPCKAKFWMALSIAPSSS